MIPGSGRSPGEGKGYPLQYSGLENSMDGGAWWATVQGVTRSQTLLTHTHTHTHTHISFQGRNELIYGKYNPKVFLNIRTIFTISIKYIYFTNPLT